MPNKFHPDVSTAGAVQGADGSNNFLACVDLTLNAAGRLIWVGAAADPHVVGRLWNNGGALTVSAG